MTTSAPGLECSRRQGSALRAGFAHLLREFWNLLAACSPARRRQQTQWLKQDGVAFLRALGLSEGNTMFDFGCGFGFYSIPAARLVGQSGSVVSVDILARMLDRVVRRAAADGLRNIRPVRDLAELARLMKNRTCHAILPYDVFHFLDHAERKRLYDALCGFLQPDGILSVHPKHVIGDKPSRHFRNMTVDDVVREIEESGFRLSDRKEAHLWHGYGCVRGIVLNFQKKMRRRSLGAFFDE